MPKDAAMVTCPPFGKPRNDRDTLPVADVIQVRLGRLYRRLFFFQLQIEFFGRALVREQRCTTLIRVRLLSAKA